MDLTSRHNIEIPPPRHRCFQSERVKIFRCIVKFSSACGAFNMSWITKPSVCSTQTTFSGYSQGYSFHWQIWTAILIFTAWNPVIWLVRETFLSIMRAQVFAQVTGRKRTTSDFLHLCNNKMEWKEPRADTNGHLFANHFTRLVPYFPLSVEPTLISPPPSPGVLIFKRGAFETFPLFLFLINSESEI